MLNVIQVLSDTNVGGAGKCILTFLRSYDRLRFNVLVVLPKDSLMKPLVEALDTRVIEVDGIAEKSLSWGSVGTLKKVFEHERPDIVHTHASMSARIAAKLCKTKIVYTRHSVFPPPKIISRGIGKKINGFINNHTAHRIIAVAEAAKENLIATGVDPSKIVVILNGVDALEQLPPYEREEIRTKYGVLPGENVVAIIARLADVKGHKYFVESAKLVRGSGMSVKFIIAGTGEEEERIRAQISEEGLWDTVIMAGFVENIAEIMNIMDVQVNCSYGTEATSLSLLEGMSLGKPAVVSDFGGNPGVIENGANGFVVPIGSPGATADAISRLFANKSIYDKMSERSRAIFEKKFTSAAYARNIEAVYAELGGISI